MVRQIIESIPAGSKFIIAVDHDEATISDPSAPGGVVILPLPMRTDWLKLMRELAAPYLYCGVLSYTEALNCREDIEGGGNHYARVVYYRFAKRVVELAGTLEVKPNAAAASSGPESTIQAPLDVGHHIVGSAVNAPTEVI